MYAWRRKAGNEVDRVAGREKARLFMAHEPDSDTFESLERTNYPQYKLESWYGFFLLFISFELLAEPFVVQK